MRLIISTILLATLLISVARAEPASATDSETSCEGPRLVLDEAVPVGLDDDSDRFLLDLPAPGFLALEVADSVALDDTLWLDVSPRPCATSGSRPSAETLARTMRWQILAVSAAGTYRLRVGRLSPGVPVSGAWISSRFLLFEEAEDGELGAHKDGSGDSGGTGENGAEESDDEIVPLMFPGFDDDLEDLFCHLGTGSKAELSFCGAEIRPGRAVPGKLDPAASQRWEYFTFTLEQLSRVTLTSRGETDTLGRLYDRHGHLLARSDVGGEGENFQIDAMLPPGDYFLRVEGAWNGPGSYELELTAVKP